MYVLSRVHPRLSQTRQELQLPERKGKGIRNSSYKKGHTDVTQAVSDSYTRLHSNLTGSSRKTDPEATEVGSAKVPLREQQ